MAERPSEWSQTYHEQWTLKDYTVKPGDSLSKIAAAHKMNLKDFIVLQWPHFNPKNKLYQWDNLKVPEIQTVNIPNLETTARQQGLAKQLSNQWGTLNKDRLAEQMLKQWDVWWIMPLETDTPINIPSAPSITPVKKFDSQLTSAPSMKKMPLETDQRIQDPETLRLFTDTIKAAKLEPNLPGINQWLFPVDGYRNAVNNGMVTMWEYNTRYQRVPYSVAYKWEEFSMMYYPREKTIRPTEQVKSV